jgi:tRNA-(ms[2]io[6]A)-hydroxylase
METLVSHPEVQAIAAEEAPLDVVIRSVPLQSATAGAWVDAALAAPLELLDDHAQCELKAASNALAMVGRFPEYDQLVRKLSALAREEMIHYRMVRERLLARGGRPTRPLPNPYVKGLGSQRKGGDFALLDDLLVGALIEARSCERFVALYRGLREREGDGELAAFYERLARSESGHANLFLGLAGSVFDPGLVQAELWRRCAIEAETLASLPVTPRMHGGHRPA